MLAVALRTHVLAALALVVTVIAVSIVAPMKMDVRSAPCAIAPAPDGECAPDRASSLGGTPPLDEEDALHDTVEREPSIASVPVAEHGALTAPPSFTPLPIRPPPEA